MIVEYLRYTVDEKRQAAFIADYKEASVALKEFEFCEQYEFCQCSEDRSKFIIRIQWTSATDHLKGFRGSKEFRTFFAHVKPYLDDIDEMRHYESL